MNVSRLFRAFLKYLKSPEYRFIINTRFKMYDTMADEKYLKKRFLLQIGYPLDLQNPKTFNEKLQWLKLYDRKPEYTMMVDKSVVKEYVAGIIGAEYIIPTLGVWDDPEDIDFDSLPDQFVLKCSHNSGLGMCICKEKSKLDIARVKGELKKGLRQNYYLTGREWPYKNVKPRIIAEKYMADDDCPELNDYKVMCFSGEPKLIQVHQGRFKNHTQDFYDVTWNRLNITQCLPMSDEGMERPAFLEEMLSVSSKLAGEIPHVRVDWYFSKEQLYFGELTFFDASGFDAFVPHKWDEIIGSWIPLPKQ